MAKNTKVYEVSQTSLAKQAEAILEQAKSKGLEKNYFFATTFKRYQVQMRIMDDLEKEIDDLGATVQKEYVKGRQNVYTNPAITEYNKTATAANGTVSTLINILKSLSDETKSNSKLTDLMAAINE